MRTPTEIFESIREAVLGRRRDLFGPLRLFGNWRIEGLHVFRVRGPRKEAVGRHRLPLEEGMEKMIIAEDSEHAASLVGSTVTVYRKGRGGMNELSLIGTGRWENGTILGSGVNCGILVRLEPSLRKQSGTP